MYSALFVVTLNKVPESPVTVKWETIDGTAVAPYDYTAASGILSFGVGETSKTISIQLPENIANSIGKKFKVRLGTPTDSTIDRAEGTVTIQSPTVS